jgi:hypothetical protein
MSKKAGKVFNRSVAMPFVKYTGEKITVNGQEITVYARDEDQNILLAVGTATLSDGASGYAKGCLYIDTDVSAGSSGIYENVGTTTSCNFDVIGGGGGTTTFVGLTDTPANYTSAANKILKVNTGGTAVEFVTVSGDVSMSATGVMTVTDLTIASEAQGDLLQRGASAWQRLAATAQGDLLQKGASVWEVITGASDGDVLRYSTGSSAWATVDPATLPAGIASGLTQSFTMEGGTNDITVSVTTQTVGAGALTIPDFAGVADTFAFLTLAQTFNGNKTFGQTNLWLQGGDSNAMNIKVNETLTGSKTLNVKINDTDRTIDLSGNLVLGGTLTTLAAWTQTGAHTIGITTTGATALTLPTSGTLATLAGSEAFTNKTYEGITLSTSAGTTVTITAGKTLTFQETITLTAAAAGQTYTLPAATDTMVGRASTDTLTNKTIDADGTGNTISNINGDELDSVAEPTTETAVYSIPVQFWCHVSNEGGQVKMVDSAPFKMVLVRAWSINTSGDGGTWKLQNNASADMTDVVTVAASDKDVDNAAQIDDANWEIGAGEDIYVVADATLDAFIFAEFLRID